MASDGVRIPQPWRKKIHEVAEGKNWFDRDVYRAAGSLGASLELKFTPEEVSSTIAAGPLSAPVTIGLSGQPGSYMQRIAQLSPNGPAMAFRLLLRRVLVGSLSMERVDGRPFDVREPGRPSDLERGNSYAPRGPQPLAPRPDAVGSQNTWGRSKVPSV